MTVHYKLIYWNCHGRGEITRLIFNYAGEKFEEHTITDADWPGTLKAAMPYGQLPVLEIDGVQLAQGRAIERFLARRFNLVGKTDIEAAHIDMIICGIDDTRQHFAKLFNEEDILKSADEVKEILDKHVHSFLDLHDKFVAKNGHNHFVGRHTTLADLAVFQILYFLTHVDHSILSHYPHLSKFFHHTSKNSRLAKYLESRPQSPF